MHRCSLFTFFIMVGVVGMLASPGAALAQTSTPDSGFIIDPNAACGESRLRVGNLANIDATIAPGVERATQEAQAWQRDSRLYTLRLTCELLVTGVKWEGVFFSESAQAFYETDTGKVDPVEIDPERIPTLTPGTIRMSVVYNALIEYGFTDDLQLTAQGGVTIKNSTSELPFGPPEAPIGRVYAHVAVERQHEIIDVWVDINDGTVYTYLRQ